MKPSHLLLKSLALLTLVVPTIASAQPLITGFLCCNMRSDAKGWITDINYEESGKHVVPAGTAVTMTGHGRNRFEFDVTGGANLPRKTYWIGNDYSRTLNPEQFSARYVVSEDPAKKLASYPAKFRTAIQAGKISVGMGKEQVLMALGYPVTSETPELGSRWKYYLWSFSPFTVIFNGDKVAKIDTDPETLPKVSIK
jgi:hypothetical protein